MQENAGLYEIKEQKFTFSEHLLCAGCFSCVVSFNHHVDPVRDGYYFIFISEKMETGRG